MMQRRWKVGKTAVLYGRETPVECDMGEILWVLWASDKENADDLAATLNDLEEQRFALLEACQSVLEVIDLLTGGENAPVVIGKPIQDALRAAIRRATGNGEKEKEAKPQS